MWLWVGNLPWLPSPTWARLHFCAPITPPAYHSLCCGCVTPFTHLSPVPDHELLKFRGHIITVFPATHSVCGKQKMLDKHLLSWLQQFPRASCSAHQAPSGWLQPLYNIECCYFVLLCVFLCLIQGALSDRGTGRSGNHYSHVTWDKVLHLLELVLFSMEHRWYHLPWQVEMSKNEIMYVACLSHGSH